MLGARVRTRWVIVGMGAKSYQTQVIFRQIVKEAIVQSNDAVLISNMRSAIKGSNVVLNMAIIPGVMLIPSKLLILDKPIEGYNNVLTIAKKSMQFGKNEDLNKSSGTQQDISNLQVNTLGTQKDVKTIEPLPPKSKLTLLKPTPKAQPKGELVLHPLPELVLGSSIALGSLLIWFLL